MFFIGSHSFAKDNAENEFSAKNSATIKKLFEFKKNIKERKWKYIVLHHSATESGTAKAFDAYHRKTFKDPEGLGYHFVIDNGRGKGSIDGLIEIGGRWQKQIRANHLFRPERANESIAICFVGNFEKSKSLTEKQFSETVKLLSELLKRYKIPLNRVITHAHIDGPGKKDGRPVSVCPGKNFPYRRFITELEKRIEKKTDK